MPLVIIVKLLTAPIIVIFLLNFLVRMDGVVSRTTCFVTIFVADKCLIFDTEG